MDKWTRRFIDTGASEEFHEVMDIFKRQGSLDKWATRHTNGMFGAIFGLDQAREMLRFTPLLIKELHADELEQYRHICAASLMAQETRIPPLFLLFRPWGYEHMRDYLTEVVSRTKQSRWQSLDNAWDDGMAAVTSTDFTQLAALSESSKLVIFQAAQQGGRLPTNVIPFHQQTIRVLRQPRLDECVQYTLEDMKSIDLAVYLKSIGQKQVGPKAERIQRILDAVPTGDIADQLNITQHSYLQIGGTAEERRRLSDATLFLHNICDAAFRLDFQYAHNLHRINQARQNKWGIRLSHHAKCPVHRKNVYRYSEINSIDPIAHPDCDADFGHLIK